MPLIDVESLLQPIAETVPCGPNLEYDPAFLDLERMIQGQPEKQIGKTVVPAQEPEWPGVATSAAALLGKTKDLRVAVTLCRALVNTDGFAGLCDGLALLRGLVERFWDGVYPLLDPSDENDPTFRINILMGICDPALVTDRVRALPLVTSRTFGRFSLRDHAMAMGEQPSASKPPAGSKPPSSPPGPKPPSVAAIDGAFSECPIADLQATAAAVKASLDHLTGLQTAVGTHASDVGAPNFSKLSTLLEQAHKILVAHLSRRGVASQAPEGVSSGEAVPDPQSLAPRRPPDMISCREDVVRLIEKICEYYQQHEPSSPLPLLLQRCKRLVAANFLDIIRDLAPDAVAKMEGLRGKDN